MNTQTVTKNTVMLVEDHKLLRVGLKSLFSEFKEIEIIAEAQNGKDSIEKAKIYKPDVILMDIGLPDINGVEATAEIRKTNKEVKIIILTSHCEKEEVLACLNSGINAYCTKDIKPDKLSNVINDVLSGSMYFDSAVSKYVLQQTSNKSENTKTVSIKDCYNLTQQEKRVLLLLSSGLSNQQIAKKLDLSVNTIKVHVCSVLQKMNVEDRTQAAIKAIRENIIT